MKAVFSLFGLLCVLPLSHAAPTYFHAQPSPLHGGTIARFDFTDPKSWPNKSVAAKNATLMATNAGTVDEAGGTKPSGGLLFTGKSKGSGFVSGLLPIQNQETNLGKLTLSFSLSATSAEPTIVRLESFNKDKKRTGGLETKIYPAAPHFYQRYALDFILYGAGWRGHVSARPTHSCSFPLYPRQPAGEIPRGRL